MPYKLSSKKEISKELKRLDRIRIMTEKTYIKEFEALDEENKSYIAHIYSDFDSYSDFAYYRWINALEVDDGLLQAYAKDKYLLSKLDMSTLARIVEQSASACDYQYRDSFFEYFEDLINKVSTSFDRVALIPISFNINRLFSIFRKEAKKVGSYQTHFGEFTLLPPIGNERALREFLNQSHNAKIKNEIDDFDHYKITSYNALTKKYLIAYPLSVSSDRAQTSVPEKFMWFRWILDFYRTTLTLTEAKDKNDEPPKHFFDFQISNSTISRYPCYFDNTFDFELSDESIEKLKNSDFSFVLNLFEHAPGDAFGRLINAIHFFSKGLSSNDNISSLLSYVISIEAIYTDNNGKITANLVKCLRATATSIEEKATIERNMSSIYGLRSAIMHRGKRWASKSDVTIAQKLSARAIRKAIDIYTEKYQENNGTVSNKDWDELLSELRGIEEAQ